MSNPVDEVREALDRGYPKSWRWDEDGTDVIGYALRKERGNTENGPCDILILQVEGEERSVWLMHTVLINKLNRLRPVVGDLVGIRQLGERVPQQGGRSYTDYNVVVHGQKGSELNWGPQPALGQGEQGEVIDAEPVDDDHTTVPAGSGDDGWG